MFSLNSSNSVTKIFVTVKGLEPATSCVRDQDVRDRIFKLSPVNASVTYQIP